MTRRGWIWLWGVLAWAVSSGAGALWAMRSSVPPLHGVVSANEFAAAFLVLPWVLTGGLTVVSRTAVARTTIMRVLAGAGTNALQRDMVEVIENRRDRADVAGVAARLGLIVFAFDLLIRWAFGLGWHPLY